MPEIGWLEPPLFRMRTVTRRGWYARLSAFLGVLLYFFATWLFLPVDMGDITWVDVLIRGTAAGLATAFVVDAFWIIRCVWIDHRGIGYCAIPAWTLSMQSLNRFAVESVTLLDAQDAANHWKRPVMVVRMKRGADVVFALNEQFDTVEQRLKDVGYRVENRPAS
ncbi:MAG: hypothetical protein IT428_23980 [Planctomycetaceae bacterium]|nr:hypothetical protein [Planctomycetaceae bacterium]